MSKMSLQSAIEGGLRPKGMDYGKYAQMCKGYGRQPMDEEAYSKAEESEYDDEEEEEDEEDARKSLISSDDLVKAMQDYANVEEALSSVGGSRQAYLEARHAAGTLTKSERVELGRLWSGGDDDPPNYLRKSVHAHLHEVDDDEGSLGQLVNASDVLKALVDGVDSAMDDVVSEVSRDAEPRDS